MRKAIVLRLLLAGMAVLAVLAACAPKQVAGGKAVTLKVMSWHGPDSDTFFYAGYKEAADAYTKMHPNVKFEFIYQPLDGYKELLDTQFIAKNAPDIIHMQQWMIQEFSNKDTLLNLDQYMYAKSPYESEKRWVDTFEEGEEGFGAAKAMNKYGAVMFIPMDGNPSLSIGQSFLYNKDLFKKAGLDPNKTPKTWKELVDVMTKLKAAGITPVAADNGRWVGWSLGMIAYQFGNKYVDQYFDAKYNKATNRIDYFWDKVYIALAEGKLATIPYMDQVLPLYKQFSTFWQDGWTGTSEAEASNLFLYQKAALYVDGFWDLSHFIKTIKDFQWGIFPLPLVTKDLASMADEGYASPPNQQDYGFVMNKSLASDPDKAAAAVDFFQYFTSRKAQAQYVKTAKSISPIKGVPVSDEMKGFVFPVDKAKNGEIVAYATIEWGDGAKWPGYVQEFLAGKIDGPTLMAKCAPLSQKTGVDYVKWVLSKDGYSSQIAAAQKTLDDMKAAGANAGAIEVQQKSVDLMKLRLEMFQQYGAALIAKK